MCRQFDQITVSNRFEDMDRNRIHDFLKGAYWSQGVPRGIIDTALDHSVPFSVIHQDDGFIGFARLVTDHSTFAYLADVFIDRDYRGHGYGHQLVEAVNEWIDHRNLRTALLLTRDAQGLYAAHNWVHFDDLSRVMRYREPVADFYRLH